MLGITRQADYALRAALELAQLPKGELISTAKIAERQELPLPFLTKIISQLVMKDIFIATRGARGGIALARDAKDITMLDLVEAIDGTINLNRCTSNPEKNTRSDQCAIYESLCQIEKSLVEKMKEVNLAMLRDRVMELDSI